MTIQLTISERIKSLACATLLATALAAPIHVGTSMTTASPAEAFGWSDIKKGAKKVGGAVKKGAKKAGGAVKKGATKAGSAVKKGAKKGAKYAGKGVKKAAKVTGKVAKGTANAGLAVAAEGTKVVTVGGATLIAKGLGTYDSEFRRKADKLRSDIDKAFTVDGVGRGVKKGGKWVGKQAKKSAIVRGVIKDAKAVGSGIKNLAGKLRATAKVPPEKRKGRASTGHQTGNFKTGLAGDKLFRGANKKSATPGRKPYWKKYRENPRNTKGIQTRKRGDRQVVGRDKSVWGNPVHGSKRKIRKAQGIRLKDIQRRKRSGRRVIGRDKSTFARPVFGKGRKMKSRRKFNNRSFNRSRRSSNKRSFNRNRRSMGNRFNRRSQNQQTRRMSFNRR